MMTEKELRQTRQINHVSKSAITRSLSLFNGSSPNNEDPRD